MLAPNENAFVGNALDGGFVSAEPKTGGAAAGGALVAPNAGVGVPKLKAGATDWLVLLLVPKELFVLFG